MSTGARRFDLVVNPTAGRGRARRILPTVSEVLRASLPATALRVVKAYDVDHAEAACREAVAEADALLVMGGDGMAHLGLNACAGTQVPLGVLPAGTGNDLCRGLGLPLDIRDAVAALTRGRTRAVDLARVTKPDDSVRWVGCVVSTGFDSRVALRTGRMRLPLGPPAYALSALAELRTFTPLRYRLTVDGVRRDLDSMAVFVANAEFFGGGMRAAPGADVTDALLDVTVIHPVPRTTLLRLLPSLYSGGFVTHPAIERFRASEVVVDGDGLIGSGDGEALGDVPLRVTAVSGALQVLG
ncbi:MAG: YegS/Rv2252/BmrU family lipid kinase [Micropruina sp.]|uniref:diacylglycerol/lipid kinase family protein n=1 Tax=Micropruina sp. TaxID=2737536 RepID=UPI0039E6AA5F